MSFEQCCSCKLINQINVQCFGPTQSPVFCGKVMLLTSSISFETTLSQQLLPHDFVAGAMGLYPLADLGLICAVVSLFLGVHLTWAICCSIVKIIALYSLLDFNRTARGVFQRWQV